MKIVVRSIALAVVLSLAFSGPLATLATAQQPSPPQPDLMKEALKTSAGPTESSTGYEVGAGLANVFFVPGKFIVCGAGIALSGALLAATFGTAYKAAAAVGKEGCGGKWALTAEDLRPTAEVGESEKLLKY
ncbi:MAG: hypothetical protein AAB418_05880 [candidate division NC10 bacterium]